MTTYCKKHRYATNGMLAPRVPEHSSCRALVAASKQTAHMWPWCSAGRPGTQELHKWFGFLRCSPFLFSTIKGSMVSKLREEKKIFSLRRH